MNIKDTKNVWKDLWKEVFQGETFWLYLGFAAFVIAVIIDYY